MFPVACFQPVRAHDGRPISVRQRTPLTAVLAWGLYMGFAETFWKSKALPITPSFFPSPLLMGQCASRSDRSPPSLAPSPFSFMGISPSFLESTLILVSTSQRTWTNVDRNKYTHFTDEETILQRGRLTCTRAQAYTASKWQSHHL